MLPHAFVLNRIVIFFIAGSVDTKKPDAVNTGLRDSSGLRGVDRSALLLAFQVRLDPLVLGNSNVGGDVGAALGGGSGIDGFEGSESVHRETK